MAEKKRTTATTNTHPASGNGPGGAPPPSAARQRAHAPGATESDPGKNPQQAAAAPTSADEQPPPGLDEARHAAAQRAAFQAEVMRQALFPAMMADALGYDNTFESRAYKVYLERLLQDAGNPTDPVERMMLEQLALAHFRIGQLQVSAGHAKALEATKIYNSAASRLLGEFRRTALALRVYRGRVPEDKPQKNLKIFKMAQ